MAFKRVPQKFPASIKEVVIGTGDKVITLGGENVLPFYSFDNTIKNPPRVGVEVSDLGPNRDLPELAKFYDGAKTIPEIAKKACSIPGASFISLSLESADPNGANKSIDDCVKLAKEVANAVTLPLVIQGSKNTEKDSQLFVKIAEALEGKNVLLMSAKEDNYKPIAAGAVLGCAQKIAAESAVDINLAKQVNVLITQMGIKNESLAMNVGSAAAGYGFEYVVSTMERIKLAALTQNDDKLQMPIITPVGEQAWSVGESFKSEADAPKGWGPQEQRGIGMEIATASSALAAGSNAVILRHPASVAAVSKLIAALV